MAVVIKKPIAAKVEVAPVEPALGLALVSANENVASEIDELAQEIDALGAAEAAIAKMKKVIADHNKRVGIVRDKLVELKENTKLGEHYYALVKEEGNKVRTVKDMPLAIKHLGVETFLKVAKIGLGDIDKYLTDAQKDEVIETSESTTRSMKILKRV